MTDRNDMDLMRAYSAHNSEPAFAELVRRHISLVYSVALRWTGNAADAQDVTQAVFIILAKKSVGMCQRATLTGWLYQTTRLTARQLLRTRSRRQVHEQEAYMQSTLNDPETDGVWRQLAPHLEAAMSRLAESDRTLLALRFYENKTGAETAALLGIREEAAHKRTARALEKLRKFFTQHGVSSTTAMLVGAISANSVQAAPVALAKTVTAVAIAKGAAASASTSTLIKGALKLIAWSKAKTVIIASAVVLLAAGATTFTVKEMMEHKTYPVEFKKVLVVVQDTDGNPVEGATILPTGFRVKGIHGADAYGWNNKLFGPPEKAVTDGDGKAYVPYPVAGIPEEKELTGNLIFGVSQPEYASVFIQSYSVDSPEKPIQLNRGIHLEVSGYIGSNHQPVTDLIPNLSEETIRQEDWQKMNDGVLAFNKLSPGGHLLQLMGRLPSGEIVYSDTTAFTAEKGKPCHLALEMNPGIRLEGRLDNNVPRPVKNGRVMISVRPKEYPALEVIEDYYAADQKYGGYTARQFWHSYRPINEDGTFVFESVPPGTADIVVLGDGFASKTIGHLQNRVNGALVKGPVTAIPQAFPLVSPITKIEVTTEHTATLEFTATTKSGRPLEGVRLGMYPSAFRMWGEFGWMKKSSEEPYREIPHLSDPAFSGKTDKNGKLVLNNIPAEAHGIDIDHPQFQVPLQDVKGWRDRHVRATFSPGMTKELNLALEPKGADFIAR